jgi:hypothetical protein
MCLQQFLGSVGKNKWKLKKPHEDKFEFALKMSMLAIPLEENLSML